jgi:hypothetical protein
VTPAHPRVGAYAADMGFLDRAKELAEQHDDKVDQALEKIGDEVDKRTDGKYGDHIDKAVDFAQEHTGDGDHAGRGDSA